MTDDEPWCAKHGAFPGPIGCPACYCDEWITDAYAAGFRAGAEAMREAVAKAAEVHHREFGETISELGLTSSAIRSLPLLEPQK